MLSLWRWLFVGIDWRTAGVLKTRPCVPRGAFEIVRTIDRWIPDAAPYGNFRRAIFISTVPFVVSLAFARSPSALGVSFFINNRQPEATSRQEAHRRFPSRNFDAAQGAPVEYRILAPPESSGSINEIYLLLSAFYLLILFLLFSSLSFSGWSGFFFIFSLITQRFCLFFLFLQTRW